MVVVKSGKRICGTGAAFSNAPIVQDKAYFEIKLQSTGIRYSLARGYKSFFMLNSTKHKISTAHKN